MTTPTFVSGVGPLAASSHYARTPSNCVRHTSRTSFPVAVASKPHVAQFGAGTSETQKYTVKVMQGDRCTIVHVNGNTDLRRGLMKEKIDIYTLGGKLRNCGGAGQCGTCVVAVEAGIHNLNGKSAKEEIMLENKPGNWRLACRTKLHGDIVVETKPKA